MLYLRAWEHKRSIAAANPGKEVRSGAAQQKTLEEFRAAPGASRVSSAVGMITSIIDDFGGEDPVYVAKQQRTNNIVGYPLTSVGKAGSSMGTSIQGVSNSPVWGVLVMCRDGMVRIRINRYDHGST